MIKNIDDTRQTEQVDYKIDLSCLKLGSLDKTPFFLSITLPNVPLPPSYPALVDVKIAELYLKNRLEELQRLAHNHCSPDNSSNFIKFMRQRRIKNLLNLFGINVGSSSISYSGDTIKHLLKDGSIQLILKEESFLNIIDKISNLYLDVERAGPPRFSKREVVWYFGRLYRVIKSQSNGMVTIFNPQYGKYVVNASDLHNGNIERLVSRHSNSKLFCKMNLMT